MMKIYFCDMCNESIPLQEIKDNKAITLKGKIYCQNCNPLKEVHHSGARAPSSAMGTSLLVVVIVLLMVLIAMMIWYGSGKEVEYATASALNQTQQLVMGLEADMRGAKEEARTREKDISDLDSSFSKIESELTLTRGDLQGQRSEIENMSKNFQSVRNVRERLDELILKQDEYEATLNTIKRSIITLEEELSDLDERHERLASSVRRGGVRTINTPGVAQATPVEDSAALRDIKKKLASKDDGERFEAVYQVLDDRIKQALPFLLPLIEDPDQFVQVGAIQTVGEFLYMEAQPALVKVLRDADVTVRDEALRQLIRMTGKNDLNFDVRASDTERERAIRKWEKWLKDRS
jgi:predicted  nucleic acid-binding Zn-ribbon protein